MSDWAELQSRLIWAYEGGVLPEYRNLKYHFPGQAAILLRQGSMTVETEKGRKSAGPGQWIFPRTGQRLQIFSDDARILSLRFDLFWPGGQPLFDWDTAIVLRSAEAPRLEAEANQLRQLVEHRFPHVDFSLPTMEGDIVTHLALHRFFSTWLCVYVDVLLSRGLQPTRLGKIDPRVLQMVKILDQHPLHLPFSEKKLARQLGLDPVPMEHLFKKQFRLSLAEYIDRRRIRSATELIQSSALPLKKISAELGFESMTKFSTWFQAQTGRPPRVIHQPVPVPSRRKTRAAHQE